MNIFEIFKDDNKKVFVLFVRLQQTKNHFIGEREHLYNQLKNTILANAEIRNKVFYSRLKTYEVTKNDVFELLNKNQYIRGIINAIDKISYDRLGWLSEVARLRKEIEEYVELEEVTLFQKARQVLSKVEIEKISDNYKTEKSKTIQKTFSVRKSA